MGGIIELNILIIKVLYWINGRLNVPTCFSAKEAFDKDIGSMINGWSIFYNIPQASFQKWIVVSPNDNWSEFNKKVLLIQINSDQVAKVCGPQRKGQQVHRVACRYMLEEHLEKGALRALKLVAIWEESLLNVTPDLKMNQECE